MTTINPVNIIADDREPDSVINQLKVYDNIRLTKQHLAIGDYEINGRLLVERKTLQDLVASIKDGRLFKQACRLANSPLQTAPKNHIKSITSWFFTLSVDNYSKLQLESRRGGLPHLDFAITKSR